MKILIFILLLLPTTSQAQPVAYKGICYSSEESAYTAFLHDWPQMSNGVTYSLQSSMLNLQSVTYTLIDHNQIDYADLYLSFSTCNTSSLSAYPMQDIIFPAVLILSTLAGLGHGFRFTGSL